MKKIVFPSPFPQSDIAFAALDSQAIALSGIPRIGANKRQLQRQLGRKAATSLLAEHGLADFELKSGIEGEPLWPAAFVGSISHSGDYAIACLAEARRYRAIGIDIESSAKARSLDTFKRILSEQERRELAGDTKEQLEIAHLFFSTKESIYKAFFHASSQKLRFHDVCLGFSGGVLSARLLRQVGSYSQGFQIPCFWVKVEHYLISAVVLGVKE